MAAPAPSDSPKPSSPHASATSVASAFISEIALTALPSCRADWNARKPASVPSAASVSHPAGSDPWGPRQLTEMALIAASATP